MIPLLRMDTFYARRQGSLLSETLRPHEQMDSLHTHTVGWFFNLIRSSSSAVLSFVQTQVGTLGRARTKHPPRAVLLTSV